MYSFYQYKQSELGIKSDDELIVESIDLEVNSYDVAYKMTSYNTVVEGNKATLEFKYDEIKISAKLEIVLSNDSISLSLDAKIDDTGVWREIHTIDPKYGYVVSLKTQKADSIISNHMKDFCWSYPVFDVNSIPEDTQGIIARYGNKSLGIIGLCSEEFKGQIFSRKNGEICINVGTDCYGYKDMSGDICSLSVASNPKKAIENAIKGSIQKKYFLSPLKKDKSIPEFVDYFGWCTWDACYFDVTHEKIRLKMEEFKEKNISVGWVLIDDGWFTFKNDRLQDMYADTVKFPHGIKGTVDMLKNEYGVKYVGIWHSYNAYWYGIEENSKVHNENRDAFIKTKAGAIIPDFNNSDKVYEFFNKWHEYLKNEGIDFVKIDTQGSISAMMKYETSNVTAVRNMQLAIEKSVKKNFGGDMINCMAMGMEHAQSRPYTSVLRNSDDFWPKRPDSFREHAIQNVYNAIFNDSLYCLDFDMWWTNNNFAEQSAVLRAISGGPIYISDEIGATDAQYIRPLIGENGYVKRCDRAAMPSDTCVFDDYTGADRVLKIVNTVNNCSVLAAYNFRKLQNTTTISYADILNPISDEYVAYYYFEKKFYKFDKNTELELMLDANKCEIINFYPVTNGKIHLGDTSKYLSAGYCNKSVDISELVI